MCFSSFFSWLVVDCFTVLENAGSCAIHKPRLLWLCILEHAMVPGKFCWAQCCSTRHKAGPARYGFSGASRIRESSMQTFVCHTNPPNMTLLVWCMMLWQPLISPHSCGRSRNDLQQKRTMERGYLICCQALRAMLLVFSSFGLEHWL